MTIEVFCRPCLFLRMARWPIVLALAAALLAVALYSLRSSRVAGTVRGNRPRKATAEASSRTVTGTPSTGA